MPVLPSLYPRTGSREVEFGHPGVVFGPRQEVCCPRLYIIGPGILRMSQVRCLKTWESILRHPPCLSSSHYTPGLGLGGPFKC